MSQDRSRNKEEAAWLAKGEIAFKKIHSLVKHAIRNYHKEWPMVFENLRRAKEIASSLPQIFSKSGLMASRLKSLTAGVRRTMARDMFGIMKDESLQFLNDSRLPDIVILDFLDRSAAFTELTFRVESETLKVDPSSSKKHLPFPQSSPHSVLTSSHFG
jgi:hypothetical protein